MRGSIFYYMIYESILAYSTLLSFFELWKHVFHGEFSYQFMIIS